MSWYPVGGNGGLPSDMLSSDFESLRRLRVESDTPFNHAAQLGTAYAGSYELTVPANTSYSIKTGHNAESCIRLTKAPGLTIIYFDGAVSGDLIQLFPMNSLNALRSSDYQFSAEVYDGPASGEIIFSNNDSIDVPYFINGGAVIEIKNSTSSPVTAQVTIGFQGIGEPVLPYMLYPGLELTGTTEMGDFNGTN